jgi:DNA invertase Pin-like site-specific DNA recombinase
MSDRHCTALLLAGYARCSSAPQERSIPEQIEWINHQVQRHGHTLVNSVFTDEAIPGHDLTGREGFQRMLNWCEHQHKAGNPVNGLITFLLSRFSRADAFATGECWNRLRRAGVRWVITSQRTYDLASRTDRMLLMIEQEGEAGFSPTLANNVTRSLASRAKAGRPVSRPPYGYRTVYRDSARAGRQEPERWEVVPEEAAVVRRIFRLYVTGRHSIRSIAEMLNAEGVEPPSRARRRKRQAAEWSASTVRDVLKREAYLGVHVWNLRRSGVFACAVDGVPVERPDHEKGTKRYNDPEQVMRRDNAHEALVDLDTFLKVKALLALNGNSPAACRNRQVYLFTGLLRCGTCEKVMGGRTKRRVRPAYWCSSWSRGGRSACSINRLNEARFLAALSAKLRQRFNPEFLAAFAAAARAELASPPEGREKEMADLKRRLDELDTQVSRHARRILEVPDTMLAEVQAAAVAVKRERDAAALKLARLTASMKGDAADVEKTIALATAAVERLEELLAGGDRAEVRAFFRDNIDRIDVYFTPPQKRGNRTERFARALVYFKPESPLCLLLPSERNKETIL